MPGASKAGKGAGHKPSKAPVAIADDGANIVFTNSKDESKPKNRNPSNKATSSKNPPTNAEDDTPKKPDTRTLVSGSASWTGKLPVNLLSEHCQKQKWEKPDYSMRKVQDGFLSAVTLKAIRPKTKETTILPRFDFPHQSQQLAVQPTAVEARNFAAVWALFRVSSMKNIHMMLPPKFRDLWKGDFQVIKKEDEKKGHGWFYEADPFTAREEQDKLEALIRKQKEENLKQSSASQQSSSRGTVQGLQRDLSRGWTNIPNVEMGPKTRIQIEEIVRKYAIWNPNHITLPEHEKVSIVKELSSIGFRTSHTEEAVAECKDREEVLEWLLVHVPEDDLPTWCLPENYHAGITFSSGNIKRDAVISRLSEAGYPTLLCEKFYDQYCGEEDRVTEALQNNLCGDLRSGVPQIDTDPINNDHANTWEEETETLQAIFGDRYQSISKSRCRIALEASAESYSVQFQNSERYPLTVPVLTILSKSLPSYIKLMVYRQAVQYASQSLLGQAMIFNLVDWLESEIPRTLSNPGKLRAISSILVNPSKCITMLPLRRTQDSSRTARRIDWHGKATENAALLRTWQQKQSEPSQLLMTAARQRLPAWVIRDQLVEAVNKNQVTIISGATGSGKSTQSPQFILDDMIQRNIGAIANIVCTQPRRVSALGLADRVSEERGSIVGSEVGYAIRGDSKQTPGETRITFMTTGVLLRRLQNASGLKDITHVMIDEIHERTLDSDFLLALLRDLASTWKDLKIILMSATLDASTFKQYFRHFSVGIVEIEGRTFDVTDHYLDDVVRLTNFNAENAQEAREIDVGRAIQKLGTGININLVVSTVKTLDMQLADEDGSILIFLPGVAEIDRTVHALQQLKNIYALPLHASLHPTEQKRVFYKAPKGHRKVIAATNVAETSITIHDCVAVIDSGRVKETSFDPQLSMVKLQEVWASKAACKQRRGRAGRVRPGNCYKLYTRKAAQDMPERPEPEITRVPLEQLCLSIYALGIRDVPSFLAKAITPPESTTVEIALEMLRRMGALDGDELTALGSHLSSVPADLRLAKLMIYGALFNCLETSLTIAAVLTVKSPFVSPQEKRVQSKAARSAFSGGHGDLLADLGAFNEWLGRRKELSSGAMRRWCDENYLSQQTLFDIASNRAQFQASLREAGFIPSNYHSSPPSSPYRTLNCNNDDSALLRSLVAGAFNPQTARIAFPDKKFAASMSGAVELNPEARTIKYFTQDVGRVFIHPSSTLFESQSFPGSSTFMAFFTKMATSKTFIRDLTPFNAYALLMFAGNIRVDTLGRGLVVDGWLRIRGWARIGVLVGRLRASLDQVLQSKMQNPGHEDDRTKEVIGMVRRLVEYNGVDR